MQLRIIRQYNFYYCERKVLGFWLKTDRYFRALSLRPARSYKDPKVVRAAYEFVKQQPHEVVEYLN